MAKASGEPKLFRAKEDLYMPSGWPMAHTAGSEFSSSDAQVAELGWTEAVESVKPADASPVTTGTPAAGGTPADGGAT